MDEDKSLREFTAKAIRPKQSDHFERLFLDLYISSFYLPPLDRVIRIIRAISIFSLSKLTEYGIDPTLIQKIKDIAIPLKSYIVTKTDANSCYHIAWGFARARIQVEFGEEIQYPQSRGTFTTVGDFEHSKIIDYYIDDVQSMVKLGKMIGRSSATVKGQIDRHNEALTRSQFCPVCKRVGGGHYLELAHRSGKRKGGV